MGKNQIDNFEGFDIISWQPLHTFVQENMDEETLNPY